MSVYSIRIDKDSGTVVLGWGDLDTVAYLARKAALADDQDYTLTVSEHAEINDDVFRGRIVASVTADAEVLHLVLRKKLAAERARVAANTTE